MLNKWSDFKENILPYLEENIKDSEYRNRINNITDSTISKSKII